MLFRSRFCLFKIVQNNVLRKRFLAQIKNESEFNESIITQRIVQNFLIPPIAENRFKALNEVTGLSLGMGCISWAKISTETLKLTEWNSRTFPDFKDMSEAAVLQTACTLKQILPESDLYVLEKSKSREASKNLNVIRLSSMLMVFLNDFKNGVEESEKVVFQKENVMNILHNLSIGNERVSARKVFEKMLFDISEIEKTNSTKNDCGVLNSLRNLNMENLECYDKASVAEQECLSFVLLLTLSFIDVFIYQNLESLQKIHTQYKFKRIQR